MGGKDGAGGTARRILDAAYGLFYGKGYARVGVDEVAAAAGVTKRTLYYHFESKDALLGAVMDLQHGLALERIRGWGARLPADAGGFVDGLFAGLGAWAARPRWAGAGFTRLAMELADLPGHPARAVAARHKGAVEDWIAGELAARGVPEAEARAREVMALLEGAQALMLVRGDRSYAADAGRAARRLVLGPARGAPPEPQEG
jgi:AcrR family transcriptional regulator